MLMLVLRRCCGKLAGAIWLQMADAGQIVQVSAVVWWRAPAGFMVLVWWRYEDDEVAARRSSCGLVGAKSGAGNMLSGSLARISFDVGGVAMTSRSAQNKWVNVELLACVGPCGSDSVGLARARAEWRRLIFTIFSISVRVF